MKQLRVILPTLAGAAAGAIVALAITGGGGGSTHTVTTTTVVSAGRAVPTASLQPGHGLSISEIYRKDGPGVVDINTASNGGGGGIFGFAQPPTRGEGAGIVYDKQGDILTDEHVVAGANSITVTFPNGRKAPAKLVGSDTGADLAVIRAHVSASELHPLPLGNSDAVQVGDNVVAIGSPFGLPNTVTAGIVSAVGRTISAPNQFTIADAIQTDAAINPGNSGGPLINAVGQVIGLNDQIETNNQNAQGQGSNSGVGFATPSNAAARIAREIIATGKARNAYVGVSLDPSISGGAAISKSAQTGSSGCKQSPVVPGGPASKAGLKPGDVITAVDGKRVTSVDQFVGTIASYSPGTTVTVTVERGGQTKQFHVKLGAQPSKPQSCTSSGGFSIP